MTHELDCKDSSNVRWARYNKETRVLEIDFTGKNGAKKSTYAYDDFPPEEWDAFCASESKGKWFAYRVRFAKKADDTPKFAFRKLS